MSLTCKNTFRLRSGPDQNILNLYVPLPDELNHVFDDFASRSMTSGNHHKPQAFVPVDGSVEKAKLKFV